MNELARIEPRSVTRDMADRYGMEPAAFEATLRATVFPANAPREQFAAFLLVAKQYSLNPITKEIYAFPSRGGGVVPIVSIDGWMRLINSHTAFDGMEFDEIDDDEGELVAIKCTIYRKDRSHPTVVTEHLSECYRPTDPWKMKHRMLRHKAAIQCARYAFGFGGIYDEDEGERIVAATAARQERPAPPVPPSRRPEPVAIEHQPAQIEIADELDDSAQAPVPAAASPAPPRPPSRAPSPVKAAPPVTKPFDPEETREAFVKAAAAAQDIDALNEAWATIIAPHEADAFPGDMSDWSSIHRKREHELEG